MSSLPHPLTSLLSSTHHPDTGLFRSKSQPHLIIQKFSVRAPKTNTPRQRFNSLLSKYPVSVHFPHLSPGAGGGAVLQLARPISMETRVSRCIDVNHLYSVH